MDFRRRRELQRLQEAHTSFFRLASCRVRVMGADPELDVDLAMEETEVPTSPVDSPASPAPSKSGKGETQKGKAKPKAKPKSKSGRKVEAGELMTCPVS